MTTYKYNPHRHIKIWLSNTPHLFMNLENQIRLSEMREENPGDVIHFLYDSTLITAKAIEELNHYCAENKVTPVDVNLFKTQLKSDNERKLFEFYQDEIQHLNEGGNLAVASDILRWLSSVYALGTYTDFDYPVETANLPPFIEVQAPLLLNIGSLKLGKKEFILANNDYIAIIDEEAAKEQIEYIQSGVIERLTNYDSDFIEKIEEQLTDSFFNRPLIKSLKNRSEILYIAKSKQLSQSNKTSREVRNHIKQIMSDKKTFIEFNRHAQNNDAAVIKKLRSDLKKQLTIAKYLFFKSEYAEIKHILKQNDDTFLTFLMKKEHDLYLKSIIIGTTGPLEICNALFNNYIVNSHEFTQKIQPFSFNHYNLQKAFKSLNSIPLHENPIAMLRFLGVREGELNDSSWLDSGRRLQEERVQKLEMQKKNLVLNLPKSLWEIQRSIEKLAKNKKCYKKQILEKILLCFDLKTNEFDVDQFKAITTKPHSRWEALLTRLFFRDTQKLMQNLDDLSHDAVVFGLTKNRKIKFKTVSS